MTTVVETRSREDRGVQPAPRSSTSPAGWAVKLVSLGLVDALTLLAIPRMIDAGEDISVGIVVAAVVALNALYLTRRAVPLKYLAPGTVFLLLFLVYPVLYTLYLSFTNFGTGNIISQGQAIEQILDRATVADTDSRQFELTVLVGADDELALLLLDDAGTYSFGTVAGGVRELATDELTFDGDAPSAVGDYRAITLVDASARQQEIVDLEIETESGVIKVGTFTTASERTKSIVYDAGRDVMIRSADGAEFSPVEGKYTSAAGEELVPGWRAFNDGDNYRRVVDNSAIRRPFVRTFVWTISFAVLSVVLTLALGLGLAMALDHPRLRGRRTYRSLLIIPYAIPSFVSALIWGGLLNADFGVVNRMLGSDLSWLGDPWLARFSVLLVNLWLGFPYMMLVSMGALQAIPGNLIEAARVDGANAWQSFRRIRFPLLLITLSPLLIASFAFNFNNFNVIFLLTGGGPPVLGSETPAGHTDILISYTYRLAFEGGRGQDFGFAAAISVVIFVVVALISAFSFRRTKAFEELV